MALTRDEEEYVISKCPDYAGRGVKQFRVPVIDRLGFTRVTSYGDIERFLAPSFRSASVCLETIRLEKGPMQSPPIDAIRIDGVIVWDEIRGHIKAEERE